MKKGFVVRQMVLALGIMLCSSTAYAAHPLITDDMGTLGKGNFQVELNSEYASDRETPTSGVETVERSVEAQATLLYGVTDAIDAVIGVPYVWVETNESDLTVPGFFHANEKGASDVSIEMKWRFWEGEGRGLAVKPGISVPTGDDQRGLGTGKYGYSLFLIGTQEAGAWVFHANLGYIHHANRADERESLCHLSLASEYSVNEKLRIVGSLGQERNPDKNDSTRPAFVLAGLIYGIAESIDIDVGFKTGLTDPETDHAVLAGLAIKF
jgi:hypothetical protein